MKANINLLINDLIEEKQLTEKERCILSILYSEWGVNKVTQEFISEHPKWTNLVLNPSSDTAKRRIRSIIRKLRVNYKIPILSSHEGYFLPEHEEEIDAYVSKLEQEAKRRAVASLETYKAVKSYTGSSSSFLDDLDSIGGQLVRLYR